MTERDERLWVQAQAEAQLRAAEDLLRRATGNLKCIGLMATADEAVKALVILTQVTVVRA